MTAPTLVLLADDDVLTVEHAAELVRELPNAQLAVVPGTSRSGITISAGLFRSMTRESAARFSFLLSTPAIGAAAAKALYDMNKKGGLHGVLNTDFLVGVAVSAITGCLVISWFLHYLRRGGLRPFVYYRIVFGIIVIALAFIRRPA